MRKKKTRLAGGNEVVDLYILSEHSDFVEKERKKNSQKERKSETERKKN